MNCLEKLLITFLLFVIVAWSLNVEDTIEPNNRNLPQQKQKQYTYLLKPPFLPRLGVETKELTLFQELMLYLHPSDYENATKLMESTIYDDTFVQQVRQVIKPHNGGITNLGQICDIFDYLYRLKIPVSDPINNEYFCKPQEYWVGHRGDCDDMAICMSAACDAIGGLSRIVLAFEEIGHAYAEICLGAGEVDTYLEYLQVRYPKAPNIQTHIDSNGNYWLNLDLNYAYPGGPYFHGERKYHYYPSVKRWVDF